MNNGITKDNMLFTLPPALKEDESTEALAEATAGALVNRLAETDRLRIICNIDNLEEPLLAILAHDFKVDWWDPSYSLEEKRQTVKGSWFVHRLMGTKAAVERAISAIYPGTKILEWFEYGGEPYHFRVDINVSNDQIDSEKQRRVLERLNYYKSLRSHNDGITYFIEAAPAIAKARGTVPGLWEEYHTPLTLPVPELKPTATVHLGAFSAMLCEGYTFHAELTPPELRGTAKVKAGAAASVAEAYTVPIDIAG